MKKLPLILMLLIGVLVLFPVAASANPSAHGSTRIGQHHRTDEAHAAWVGLNGCRLHSQLNWQSSVPATNYYIGKGFIDTCGGLTGDAHMNVQTCMWQLVTGGWQQMNWTCDGPASSPQWASLLSASTPRVCLTPGRWYNEWTWGYVNGATGTYFSGSLQGGSPANCPY